MRACGDDDLTCLYMKQFITLISITFISTAMAGAQTPAIGGCSIFPSNNVWNTRVDTLPVNPNSGAWVSTIGSSSPIHPDFGSASNNGIPYNVVNSSQKAVTVSFTYADESDPGPYPIPTNPVIEGGSDHHILLVDTANCTDYELYSASQNGNGSWSAGSGAIFPLTSNQLRPAGWTSADAAGLPILPGLVKYDEVAAGVINHAIRFTAPAIANSYIWPARHEASYYSGTQYPPMGARFRLKASVNISSFPAPVQVILTAMKKYGIILADSGAPWFISGAPDSRWNDDVLHTLTTLNGSDIEAVDESSLMVNSNSAQASLSSSVPTGQWVSLVSLNSGKCVEAHGRSEHSPLMQWDCSGSSDQMFKFTSVNGGYMITVESSGLQLNVEGGPSAKANGTAVIQYPYSGTTNEIFTVTPASTAGYYEIHPLNDGSCLDVHLESKADGMQVYQWQCTGNANQAWKIQLPN